MRTTYDQQSDILYVRMTDIPSARQVVLDDARIIDYSSSDEFIGVEFIGARAGIDLRGVPFASAVERSVGQSGRAFPITGR